MPFSVSSRPAHRGFADHHIDDRANALRIGIEDGSRCANDIARWRQARFKTIANNPLALARLCNGGTPDGFASPRCSQLLASRQHFNPNGGDRTLLLRPCALGRVAGLFYPRPRCPARKEVEPYSGAHDPRRSRSTARPVIPFVAALHGNFGQERTTRARSGDVGQIDAQRRLFEFGTLLNRRRRRFDRRAGRSAGRRRERQHNVRVENPIHQSIQLGAGDSPLGRGVDRLRAHLGQVSLHREHIGVARRARVPACPGGARILLSCGDRRLGRKPGGIGGEHSAVGARGRQHKVVPRLPLGRLRHGGFERRRSRGGASTTAIEERVLHRKGAARVGDRVGMIQLLQGEIRLGKLTLCQQRAEDEHGLIASLPRLREIDFREVAGARLRHTFFRLTNGSSRAGHVRIGREHGFDDRRERERFLGIRICAERQPEGQKHTDSGGSGHGHLLSGEMQVFLFGHTWEISPLTMRGVTKAGTEHPSDEYAELIADATAGNAQSLERLLMKAQEVAYRFSRTVCGGPLDADDVMQDALLKTYQYVNRIRDPHAFRTWLYRTVRNACLMKRRRRAGEPDRMLSLDELLPAADGRTAGAEPAGAGRNPEALALDRASRRGLVKALQALPPSYRSVVFLREMEGLSTREVAQVLKISEPNVKMRLHRARLFLRKQLEE